MKNTFLNLIKIILGLAVALLLLAVSGMVSDDKESVVEEPASANLCFYKETGEDLFMLDRAWLRLDIDGDAVTGEFQNLPAQTDSKVGEFSGTTQGAGGEYMSADLWWQARAEGTLVTEQLKIEFNESTARVGFGELVPDDQGRYVYANPNEIPYWQNLVRVPCGDLDERLSVAEYIREHVRDLAPEDPVLGGQWYAFGVVVNPGPDMGTFMYEDGHIQGFAEFGYKFDGGEVTILNVEKIEY
jgi:hypothetical protein